MPEPTPPPVPATGPAPPPSVPAAGAPRQFPCAQCGALLQFSPGAAKLKCGYCGHENDVPQAETPPAIQELDYNQALSAARDQSQVQTVAAIQCDNCGAQFTLKPGETATSCPFCGSAVVREAPSVEQFKPKALLPFKITLDQAHGFFRDWLKGLWFAPNVLKYAARSDKSGIVGMYTPYWTYDSPTYTTYTGQRGTNYTVQVNYTATENGRTVTRTRSETRIRWVSVAGQVSRNFDDVLVLASSALPREITEKLEPWDLNHLVPYADGYLAGFRSERYQVDLVKGFDRAKEIMADTIRLDIKRDIGGDHQRIGTMSTNYGNVTYKHILLPIWIAAYKFKDKSFRFVVNGRTGEVQGERPWSWLKIGMLVTAIVIAAGVGYWIYAMAGGPK